MSKEYQGGTQELRDAMADAFRDWDWSGWEVIGSDWPKHEALDEYHLDYLFNGSYKFRRKPLTLTINGVEVPVPSEIGGVYTAWSIKLDFKSEEECDQFAAEMRKAMDGGE